MREKKNHAILIQILINIRILQVKSRKNFSIIENLMNSNLWKDRKVLSISLRDLCLEYKFHPVPNFLSHRSEHEIAKGNEYIGYHKRESRPCLNNSWMRLGGQFRLEIASFDPPRNWTVEWRYVHRYI